mgnify:CR=1 FL=1
MIIRKGFISNSSSCNYIIFSEVEIPDENALFERIFKDHVSFGETPDIDDKYSRKVFGKQIESSVSYRRIISYMWEYHRQIHNVDELLDGFNNKIDHDLHYPYETNDPLRYLVRNYYNLMYIIEDDIINKNEVNMKLIDTIKICMRKLSIEVIRVLNQISRVQPIYIYEYTLFDNDDLGDFIISNDDDIFNNVAHITEHRN